MSAPDFVKHAPAEEIRTEAASLQWLAEASEVGGVDVVDLTSVDAEAGMLTTRRLTAASPDADMAREFGRRLAHTHAAGAPHFGAPPPGVGPRARYAGVALPMVEEGLTFGQFYARHRMAPYLRAAVDRGSISTSGASVIEGLISRVERDELTSQLPALCRERKVAAARTHGDLWGGNVFYAHADGGARAFLIDPAAHGAHAETDLGALALFGTPYLSEVIAGYESASRLAAGWQERVGLHQMHMLLVHAVLFGSGYGAQCVEVARRYVR
ncbi:MAG: fructosamine kinase family protein [Bowdeniella nasicola]|nr:fructosamine kinase family protein [Bowdeniella nasicola]